MEVLFENLRNVWSFDHHDTIVIVVLKYGGVIDVCQNVELDILYEEIGNSIFLIRRNSTKALLLFKVLPARESP